MESTTCVDTSLNLNVRPSHHIDVAGEALAEQLRRLSSENKRLNERLTRMSESYSALRKLLSQMVSEKLPTGVTTETRKRKAETGNCMIHDNNNNNVFGFSGASECSSISEEDSPRKANDYNRCHSKTTHKVSRLLVRTEASDPSLYVRDGYQWRKYGQKVTRDNPFPRAYFKCSHAPTCPVKKKVQRSIEDPTILVATYEGEHNHAREADLSSPGSPKSEVPEPNSIHHNLVQRMASFIARDPNFTSALATAISGTMLDHTTIRGSDM